MTYSPARTYDRTPGRIAGRKLQRFRRHLFQTQPLCVICEEMGRIRAATERDHIVALCNGGTDTEENVQGFCHECHEAKTLRDVGKQEKRAPTGLDGWPVDYSDTVGMIRKVAYQYRRLPHDLPRSRIPLTLVCGPPGSGKSTYVRTHAGEADTIIDLDAIMQTLSGLPIHAEMTPWLTKGLELRNQRLRDLATDAVHERAWFIIACPNLKERQQWASMLGAKVVVLDVPAEECKRRIRADPARMGHEERMCKAVDRWWGDARGATPRPRGDDEVENKSKRKARRKVFQIAKGNAKRVTR